MLASCSYIINGNTHAVKKETVHEIQKHEPAEEEENKPKQLVPQPPKG